MKLFRCHYGHVFELGSALTEGIGDYRVLVCPKCGLNPKPNTHVAPLPEAVAIAFEKHCKSNESVMRRRLAKMYYSTVMGCYIFGENELTYGIGTDGTIHT